MNLDWIPVYKHWRLNERHYGALQGLNKAEMTEDMVSSSTPVEAFLRCTTATTGKDRPKVAGNDPRYALVPEDELPLCESLKDTEARVVLIG